MREVWTIAWRGLKLGCQTQAENPALGVVSLVHRVLHVLYVSRDSEDVVQGKPAVDLEYVRVVHTQVAPPQVGIADPDVITVAAPEVPTYV